MSPKFALGLLFLCLVLLGLSDAQRPQQRQVQGYGQRQGARKDAPKYRNLGGDGSFGTDPNPPPLDAPGDCNQNNLAGNNRDRFNRRH